MKLLFMLWSYCVNCLDRQEFTQIDGKWVCNNCGKPKDK
jgi:rubredoxin